MKIVFGLILLLSTFLQGCTVIGIRSQFQEIDYSVVASFDGVEVREYAPRLAVEVVDATSDAEAFRLLFDYISGDNTSSASLSMTTPVEVESSRKQIAMTTPVEVQRSDETVRMRFFLPRDFQLRSAPTPRNPRLRLIELPAQTMSALRYSWSGSRERFYTKAEHLRAILDQSPWTPIGDAVYFGYDPPFTIPFLRRHEALIPVRRRSE